jgi:Peptidase family M28/PA domain
MKRAGLFLAPFVLFGLSAPAFAQKGVKPQDIAPHIKFLSDDLLEGRAPGSRGEKLATRYIAAQMEALGLEPGGEGGTFFQKVPLVGIVPSLPRAVTIKGGGKSLDLAVPSELVIMSGNQSPSARIADAEVVFVGYGIVAPEHKWDDYAGVDVKGKVVLVMNNDPESDPALFGGKTRLWYGRWDYKYLEAARHGAAGAIIIHTVPSAAYPWQVVESSNTGERFELPAGSEPRLQARMWASEEASRKIASLGGKDLDALRAAAEKRANPAVPLGVTLAAAFQSTVRRLEGENVLGRLPGSDAKLKDQVVVYTAHHDHLGVRAPKDGDAIYNGALDNASGVALLLAMAKATSQGPRPRRSLLFLTVTAEEQGLLGSEYFCRHPTVPPGKIAANLNVDSINKDGRTKDFGFIGYGKSSLDALVEAAARSQGRTVHGDPFPDKGTFYRSDQFNFARIGVPAIYLDTSTKLKGKPAEEGKQKIEAWEAEHYHQPSDELTPDWNYDGMIEDARLGFHAGLQIANTDQLPAWNPGDEFEAARKQALQQAGK